MFPIKLRIVLDLRFEVPTELDNVTLVPTNLVLFFKVLIDM